MLRIVILSVALFLSACSSEISCTADFKILTVSIVDSFGKSVADVEVRTVLESDGTVLVTDRDSNDLGDYVLVDDSAFDILKNRSTPVLFEVERRDIKRSFPYTVKANSCHVESYEGSEIIELE